MNDRSSDSRKASQVLSSQSGMPHHATTPRTLLSVLLATTLLAAGLFYVGRPTWAEGLLIGMGMSGVHSLSWSMILDALIPPPRLSNLHLAEGVLLKLLFVYAPVVWLVGEPPALGLFVLVGFTVVLFATGLERTKILPRVLPLSVVAMLLGLSSPLWAMSSVAPSPSVSMTTAGVEVEGAFRPSPLSLVSGPSRLNPEASVVRTGGQKIRKTTTRKHDQAEEKHVELPTIGQWAKVLFPSSPVARFLANPHVERAVWTLFVTLLVALLIAWVARHAAFHPGRLQAAMELSVQWIVDLLATILPEKEARQFLPYIGGLFIYILVVNLSGLIPFAAPGTTFISMTAGLAACTFLVVQYMAFTRLGLRRYLYHLAGEPSDRVTWAMSPLMVVLHLVEELAKPITLSVRLFGNVFAEHTLLAVMAVLGVGSLAFIHSPLGLPFELPFMFLALLTGSIQALVFAVLSAVYIALVLPHEE